MENRKGRVHVISKLSNIKGFLSCTNGTAMILSGSEGYLPGTS